MTVTQTARLLRWVIAGLILLGVVLYIFGPAALRTDEVIVVGLMIAGLVWLDVGSAAKANEIRTRLGVAVVDQQ